MVTCRDVQFEKTAIHSSKNRKRMLFLYDYLSKSTQKECFWKMKNLKKKISRHPNLGKQQKLLELAIVFYKNHLYIALD